MRHLCHAHGCKTPVKPSLLFCAKHWAIVPKEMQKAVYASYRRGQCDDKSPSNAWMVAAETAIAFVARYEGHERAATYYEEKAELFRERMAAERA